MCEFGGSTNLALKKPVSAIIEKEIKHFSAEEVGGAAAVGHENWASSNDRFSPQNYGWISTLKDDFVNDISNPWIALHLQKRHWILKV